MASIRDITGINQQIKLEKKNKNVEEVQARKKPGRNGASEKSHFVKDKIEISEAAAKMKTTEAEISRFVDIVKSVPSASEEEIARIESEIEAGRFEDPQVADDVARELSKLPYFSGQMPETIAGYLDLHKLNAQRKPADPKVLEELRRQIQNGTYTAEAKMNSVAEKMAEKVIFG